MPTTPTKTKPPPLELLGATGAADYQSGAAERFVPSFLKTLDDMILGAVATELVLLAGKPGDGKTSLAMQWAVSAAQNGLPAGVLSLEMGRRSLLNRLVSGMTGIPMTVLRTRNWPSAAHKKRAIESAEFFASIPLYVDDRSGLDAQRVYDTIVSWGQQGIELAVVDYVQRMGGTSDSRNQQVGDAVRALKSAAKDADIPVLAISSLNRQGAGSEKPRMSWLRESGDLEYEADTILMFHYPDSEDENEDIRQCDIHVIKQRNGPTGVASVQFNKPATRFEELEHGKA